MSPEVCLRCGKEFSAEALRHHLVHGPCNVGDVERIRAERLRETDWKRRYDELARDVVVLCDQLESAHSGIGESTVSWLLLNRVRERVGLKALGLPNIQPEGE